ncbi:MAG: P-II family nitrogen regulator [Planctomycetes bacterium]|nr:P-II family nitrogen regulator [Planctomycetota bacterium]
MKRLVCFVKPFRLDAVLEATVAAGGLGVTITQVRGYGRQKGHLALYHGGEYAIAFLPKARVEFLAPDPGLEVAISRVTEAARTGRIGDGKIFVFDVVEAPET